jgi:hypothetical protein
MPALSDLSFASILSYFAHGTSPEERFAQDIVRRGIKLGQFLKSSVDGNYFDPYERAAEYVENHASQQGWLGSFFGDRVWLVPAPGSSPAVKDAMRPPLRACEALFNRGLAGLVVDCVERSYAVPKSHLSATGQRPDFQKKYDSTRVIPQLETPDVITVVDDVVTTGATLLAVASRLKEVWPSAMIRGFAIVRTLNAGEFNSIVDPIAKGTILLTGGRTYRNP